MRHDLKIREVQIFTPDGTRLDVTDSIQDFTIHLAPPEFPEDMVIASLQTGPGWIFEPITLNMRPEDVSPFFYVLLGIPDPLRRWERCREAVALQRRRRR